MITIHWAWLLIGTIVIAGVAFFAWMRNDEGSYGIGGLLGCFGLIAAILIAAAIGGIFIW